MAASIDEANCIIDDKALVEEVCITVISLLSLISQIELCCSPRIYHNVLFDLLNTLTSPLSSSAAPL